MQLSMIWAMTRNRVIGRDNGLPWRLPRDMRHFMTTTRGHPVIMGRRTFESMDSKPLPRRTNVVVTRNAGYEAPGAVVAASLPEAVQVARRQCQADGAADDAAEAFIIGGAGLYAAGLAVADRLYVTEIDAVVDGDTYFPEVDWSGWREIERQHHPADAANAYAFDIVLFERA